MPGATTAAARVQGQEKPIRSIVLWFTVTVAVAIMCLGVLAGSAESKQRCHSRACEIRVASKQCSQTRVVPCIRLGALRYRQPFWLLLKIAKCESGLRPRARNPSGSSGLMQFMPATFAGTPYRSRSIFSARWNALAGAWLLRAQGTDPWTASRHCWG